MTADVEGERTPIPDRAGSGLDSTGVESEAGLAWSFEDGVTGTLLENEFARVVLSVDRAGNSPRLRIAVPETGEIGYLDALSLERLAGLAPEELTRLFRTGSYATEESAHASDGGTDG